MRRQRFGRVCESHRQRRFFAQQAVDPAFSGLWAEAFAIDGVQRRVVDLLHEAPVDHADQRRRYEQYRGRYRPRQQARQGRGVAAPRTEEP